MSAFTLAISKILLLRTSINGQKKHFKKLYIGVKYIEIYKKSLFYFNFNPFAPNKCF